MLQFCCVLTNSVISSHQPENISSENITSSAVWMGTVDSSCPKDFLSVLVNTPALLPEVQVGETLSRSERSASSTFW